MNLSFKCSKPVLLWTYLCIFGKQIEKLTENENEYEYENVSAIVGKLPSFCIAQQWQV